MHRQALLVSLSLSPASTAAKNDKHWAFLDEIDAPQWADLKAEEALAKAKTIGDDPWFYRSHSHHEVPLVEIACGQVADGKDSNSSVITPNLERKKNRGSSKAKLAFDVAPTLVKSNDTAHEAESPQAGFHDSFGADSPRIASPVHCKSPDNFLSTRRVVSSDDYAAGNDGTAGMGSFNCRFNLFENQFSNDPLIRETDVPVSCTPKSAECEDKPLQSSLPWQESFLSKLKDTSRLRKSLGSALRVKIGGAADHQSVQPQGAATRPKSRLRQSVQLEAAALPVVSGCEVDPRKGTACLSNGEGLSIQNCQSSRISSGDADTGTGLENKLGVNSSVQAFDDIRKMRKSWGSALRVKVGEGSPVQGGSSKHVGPAASDENFGCTSVKPKTSIAEALSRLETKAGSEEKELSEALVGLDLRAHNPADRSDGLSSVEGPEVSLPTIVPAAVAAKKTYRRSVSFDHAPGRGTDSKASTSSRSNLSQQIKGSRASSVSRLNGPVAKPEKGSRLSKGGKENTSSQSVAKTTKVNPEPSAVSPRKSRQSSARMSMPSLTFAAHARAAMGANGGTILKPSGNSVVESNRLDSSKATASTVKKSAGWPENGCRKKTEAPGKNVPSKMITRQSILRSSMPVFSATAAAANQPSKPVFETGVAALKLGGKNGSKIANGDADLVALLAEHNRKFRPKPTYEPRIHRVKDIREWEARTGQLFYNLQPAERERANQEISAAKQTQTQAPK